MAMINGYPIIHKPDSIHANKDGYVYEHILIAEQVLGFEFTHGEVVHHKDLNRSNNNPNNLIVFASKSEHMSFHRNNCDKTLLKQLDNGTYITIRSNSSKIIGQVNNHNTITITRYTICPICNKNLKTYSAKMCLECYQNQLKHCEWQKITEEILPRQLLKELIRTTPFEKIGEMYKVTGSAIRKWCDKYNLPRRKKDIKQYSDEEWEKL